MIEIIDDSLVLSIGDLKEKISIVASFSIGYLSIACTVIGVLFLMRRNEAISFCGFRFANILIGLFCIMNGFIFFGAFQIFYAFGTYTRLFKETWCKTFSAFFVSVLPVLAGGVVACLVYKYSFAIPKINHEELNIFELYATIGLVVNYKHIGRKSRFAGLFWSIICLGALTFGIWSKQGGMIVILQQAILLCGFLVSKKEVKKASSFANKTLKEQGSQIFKNREPQKVVLAGAIVASDNNTVATSAKPAGTNPTATQVVAEKKVSLKIETSHKDTSPASGHDEDFDFSQYVECGDEEAIIVDENGNVL